MQRYANSFRSRNIKETLVYAKRYAKKLGVSRVTNTVRLDNIGVPVYASIRPNAMNGSLCVSSGKGSTNEEAEIGAYMEAIELALAEPNLNKNKIQQAYIHEILDGNERPNAILDFCPIYNTEIPINQKVNCVKVQNLFNENHYLIPAEVVFVPYNVAPKYFGSNSNGLCSGNSLVEATIHGILEVMERDIASFHNVKEEMFTIHPNSYPKNVRKFHEMIQNAGHDLVLRYGANQYKMPFVMGTVIDGEHRTPVYINSGYGCHFDKNIAMTRAVTEALQTRLNVIHGSRDDLSKVTAPYQYFSIDQLVKHYENKRTTLLRSKNKIDYQDIPEYNWSFDSLEDYQISLLTLLKRNGFNYVLRLAFTEPEEFLQIVRITIPQMELFSSDVPKIGNRLTDFTNKLFSNSKKQ